MKIKKIGAKIVKDSRNEDTILVWIKTSKGKFFTTSPSGKSKGNYEVESYLRDLKKEIEYIEKLKLSELNIEKFEDLKKVEKYVKLGGNSLFALEASLLKALAKENEKELYEFLGGKKTNIGSVGNAVGGGLHSQSINNKKPDFQEFHFISKTDNFYHNVKINGIAYKIIGRLLSSKYKNDEGAWKTSFSNEEILEKMKLVQEIMLKKGIEINIGLDIASDSFFNRKYFYKNPNMVFNKKGQLEYIKNLIKKYDIFYIEDPLEENDFEGFSYLLKETEDKCLIVGDDLIATNPERLKKAIKKNSINAVIIKPNQIGSLIKMKETIAIAKKYNIKTIISHRSGETKDSTIADFAVGFGIDYIKTGIYGKFRESKLKKIIKIERDLKNRH